MKKIVISTFYLFLIIVPASSQSCKELQNTISELLQKGRIEQALKLEEKILLTCKKEYGKESTQYVETLDGLSMLYSKIGDSKNTISLFQQIITIQKKILGEEHPDYATSLTYLASEYLKIGNYIEAEKLFLKSVTIRKKVLGEEHPDYATSLDKLATLYGNVGNYLKAEPLYIKAISIRRIALGELHQGHAASIINLAWLYTKMGSYIKAETLYLQAITIQKKSIGETHPSYASSINNLAWLYSIIGEYSKAEPLYLQAIAIRKSTFGEEHPQYANSLINLASFYCSNGKILKAEALYLQAIAIQKKTIGEQHPTSISSLELLALYYSNIGNYLKAEPLYLKTVSIQKKIIGEEHPDFAQSLEGLAQLYTKMGEYSKAKVLYLQIIAIQRKTIGEEHPEYANTLNELAYLYTKIGDDLRAEKFYIQSLDTYKKYQSESNTEYASLLNNMAVFYNKIGNFSKSESFYIQVVNIRKKLGEENPYLGNSLNDLALLYTETGNFSKAESLFLQSLNIEKRVYGKENASYAITLNNLALLYTRMGEFTKAENIYLQVLNIEKNELGESNPSYAITLNNLASLLCEMGNYLKAEQLYLEAINIEKKTGVENSPEYAKTINNLGRLYYISDKPLLADSKFSESLKIQKKKWQSYFGFLSGSEVSTFLEYNLSALELPLSFLSRNTASDCKNEIADFNIMLKNGLLINNQYLEKCISNSKDSIVINNWHRYKAIKLQISKQLQLSLSEQHNVIELKEQSEVLEKELMQKLPDFQEGLINNKITWKEIQSKLKPNEIAIDFINFRYFDKHWTDTILYAALVIRPDQEKPQFINLFREEQLASLFDFTNNSGQINTLYCGSKTSNDSNCTFSLYNLLWRPMDSLLIGIKKIYVSPSGLLHRISFTAIVSPLGGRLIDHYSIETISNIRVLAEHRSDLKESPVSLALIGGIDYDKMPSVTVPFSYEYDLVDTAFYNLRTLRNNKWTYLKGTNNEIIDIKNLGYSLKMDVKIFNKDIASEENFKNLGSGNIAAPSILHIATHGFAYSTSKEKTKKSWAINEIKKSIYQQSGDPMTRVGLVMSGANKIWITGLPYQNHEDGILTAREVSNLDLHGCILATLSACETGLGEIKGSEGVFGLQRAFKMAGVHYLIVSLWKVPDAETADFMTTFYTKWLKDKTPIKEAFRQTQIQMNQKYTEPYKWAGFVLIE